MQHFKLTKAGESLGVHPDDAKDLMRGRFRFVALSSELRAVLKSGESVHFGRGDYFIEVWSFSDAYSVRLYRIEERRIIAFAVLDNSDL